MLGTSESIGKAFGLASFGHFGQKRKYIEEAYICHPVRVMSVIAESLTAEEIKTHQGILEAAIGHDLLEDTNISENQIKGILGKEVLALVKELTFPSSKMPKESPRVAKFEADTKQLKIISNTAKIIKMSDRFDNLRDIELSGYRYSNKYLKEAEIILEICAASHSGLAARLDKRIKDKYQIINSNSMEWRQ